MTDPLTLTIRIHNDILVITQPETQNVKSYRISELNLARLGGDLLHIYMDSLAAPKCPRIEKDMGKLAKAPPRRTWLTADEYAALNHMSPSTVKRLCVKKKLRSVKKAGRWRIEDKPV